MLIENNKNLISKYIKGVNKKYLYRDINYDDRGIDYTHFIKLRLTTFDIKHNFIEQFTPEGFRILWYLMTRGKQNTYITITLNTILESLQMTKHKVIKGIQALINSNIIEIYNTKEKLLNEIKDIHTTLNILIKYHNDDVYTLDNMNGYRAIPFDFIYRAILDLNEKEFTLLMYLIVRNRYYYVSEYIDQDTGEISSKVNNIGYSFPTQENIAKKLRIDVNRVSNYTESLESKGYIIIDKNREKKSIKNKNTNKQEIKNMNYTYKVKLLNRFEYITYHIINIANEEINNLSKDLQKYIKNTDVNELLIEYNDSNKISLTVKNSLFLQQLYGDELKEYYSQYDK